MPGYLTPAQPTLNAFTPTGNISATTIADAIVELDTEKEKNIPLQSSAPSSPVSGDLWVDNTVSLSPVLKVYDGSSWIVAGSSITVNDRDLVLAQRMFA
jgi:hypothetical protein